MRTFALASGSSGNCFYVETSNGTKIVIDVGITFSRMKEILDSKSIDIFEIDAFFITHEHSDHVCGLKTTVNKLKSDFYMSNGTYIGVGFDIDGVNIVKHHDSFKYKDVNVFVVSKPHDSLEAVSYVLECDGKKLGVFTDMGHVSDEIKHIVKGLDIVYFEANYCEDKVKLNKDFHITYLNRLISDIGHLGVMQSAKALCEMCHDNQTVILSHISQNTNTYTNAYTKIKESLESAGKFPKLLVSFQASATEWIEDE